MADELAELHARLRRYPASRYPAQHATAQFHLGATRLEAGDTDGAVEALAAAERLFGELRMSTEHAKATMMLGAGLRAAGDHRQAHRRFTAAARLFKQLDRPAEEAAARYNAGLVLTESGRPAAAVQAFATAQHLFAVAGRRSWAGAAARERGRAELNRGEPRAAIALLEEAIELSGEADPAGTGAAANVQGLAQLAAGDPAAAVHAFRRALSWLPRSVRPAEHAMAKANLALAQEAAGARAHARVLARQALAVPQAAAQVRAVAQGVLDRLPTDGRSDLFTVLEGEDIGRWELLLRDELLRWIDLDPVRRRLEAASWVREQCSRGAEGVEFAQALLGALLELPPPAYQAVLDAVVRGVNTCQPEEATRFQAVTGSAMARYPLPQWHRMAAGLTAAAQQAGLDQQWR